MSNSLSFQHRDDTQSDVTSFLVNDTDDQGLHNNQIQVNPNKQFHDEIDDKKATISVTNFEKEKAVTPFGTTSGNIYLNRVIGLNENIFCVRATPDSNHWAVGLQNGNISFFATENNVTDFSINSLKCLSETYPVTHMEFVTFTKENKGETKHLLLASYASGCIRLWHYTNPNVRGRLVREWKEKYFDSGNSNNEGRLNQILCVSVSGDTKRFVTGGDDHVIKVYEMTSKVASHALHRDIIHNLQTGKASDAVLKADFHTLRITAIKYHPLGKFDTKYLHVFISASWDNTIQIWDDRNPGSLWQYNGPHVCGADGIDIDPISNTIVSCSWKRDKAVLQIWKFNEFVLTSSTLDSRSLYGQFNEPCSEYYQDSSQIPSQGYVALFIFSGQFIIYGGSNNNLFRIVDATTFSPLAAMFNIKSAVISASVISNPDKKRDKVAVVTAKEVLIFNIDSKVTGKKSSVIF